MSPTTRVALRCYHVTRRGSEWDAQRTFTSVRWFRIKIFFYVQLAMHAPNFFEIRDGGRVEAIARRWFLPWSIPCHASRHHVTRGREWEGSLNFYIALSHVKTLWVNHQSAEDKLSSENVYGDVMTRAEIHFDRFNADQMYTCSACSLGLPVNFSICVAKICSVVNRDKIFLVYKKSIYVSQSI